MKIGIVGTGAMGQTHAESWQKLGVEIGGFVSRSGVSAEILAQKYNSKSYTSLSALLPYVDIIDLCTPTDLHYAQTLQAARAGKHIICEKPLARTLAQAQEMISVCEQQNVKLLVAHVVRYFPAYAAAKAQVNIGGIGSPTALKLQRIGSRPAPQWLHAPERSGGMLLDLMIHDYDFARWVAGEVVAVQTIVASHSAENSGIDDATVKLTYESGATSIIEGSWSQPPDTFYTSAEIVGTKETIRFNSNQEQPNPENPYTIQLREFYHHLTNGKPLSVTAADGLRALEIGLAALDSCSSNPYGTAETGKEITLR